MAVLTRIFIRNNLTQYQREKKKIKNKITEKKWL